MGWNGADLVTEFSAEAGDSSTTFKAKVLNWINEGLIDISSSHEWPFFRVKGKAVLTSGQDTHSLILAPPSAPTLAALAGGSLIDGTEYKVLVTYYEGVAEVESKAGTVSAGITPSGANLSITVTIPVSASSLVTERRIYLSKAAAAYYYYGTVSNNTATSTTVTADVSASETRMAPDYDAIGMIDGDLFVEGTRVIRNVSNQDMTFLNDGVISTGYPSMFADLKEGSVRTNQKPASNLTASFYYFKHPMPLFNSATSYPQLPIWLKPDLRNYVNWRVARYRDRAGKESEEINYRTQLALRISRKGKSRKGPSVVRVKTPDSDGLIY